MCDRLVTSARAARLGLYCSSAITSSTRCLVSGRMLGCWLSTRETVWCETPARRATSRMLGARPRVDSCVGSGTVTSIDSGMFTVTHAAATIMHGSTQNVTVTM